MDMDRLLAELCYSVRNSIAGLMGTPQARNLTGRGESGDETFAIDAVAELTAETFLQLSGEPLAYYSEDRGLVEPLEGEPRHILIIDPIDGTRPATAGLECSCVSVAVAPFSEKPRMSDVTHAAVLELKEDRLFTAVRGSGARIFHNGFEVPPVVHAVDDMSTLFWTLGFRGRPAAPLAGALAPLIDMTSVRGAVFDLGSAAYCMTRLLTGQMNAFVDIGDRLIEEIPSLEEDFRAIGGGSVLNNFPYDVAASILILEEAGLPVTDASGRGLSSMPLTGSGVASQVSIIAATDEATHAFLLERVGEGIARFKEALPELRRVGLLPVKPEAEEDC